MTHFSNLYTYRPTLNSALRYIYIYVSLFLYLECNIYSFNKILNAGTYKKISRTSWYPYTKNNYE